MVANVRLAAQGRVISYLHWYWPLISYMGIPYQLSFGISTPLSLTIVWVLY